MLFRALNKFLTELLGEKITRTYRPMHMPENVCVQLSILAKIEL
jgi:hypothetical protein